MLDLELVGRQLIAKASIRRNAAARYEVDGNDLHVTIWLGGSNKKVLTYNVLPAMFSSGSYTNHIGNVMWIRMEEAWDAQLINTKPNKTILLCLNILDC